jgi:amidase
MTHARGDPDAHGTNGKEQTVSSGLEYLELSDVAERIRARQLSPVEVTEAVVSRVEQLDPKLHCFARLTPEIALEQARRAEGAIAAGEYLGPLHGIPIAVKDNCDTKGIPTTNGLALFDDRIPAEDATVVRRLREAGAVLIGKLQHTEGAFAEHRPDIEIPLSPWDEELWVGASSSGSGVATAAGLCFASLGTDTGGSIRFPCAANNLVGVKPTWGRVSRFGVFENSASMDHVGPMTRSARDAASVLRVLAGQDARDPTSSYLPVDDYPLDLQGDPTNLVVGVDPGYALEGVDDAAAGCVAEAVDVLRSLGVKVIEVSFPDTSSVVTDWLPLSGVEMATAHLATYPSHKESYGPALRGLIELGRSRTGIDYFQRTMRRLEFQGQLNALFGSVDIVITPTQAKTAPTVLDMSSLGDEPEGLLDLVRFTAPNDLSGHPAIALPGGVTDAGHPVSFQLLAAHFAEGKLFRMAHAYQSATTWHKRHPEV